MQQFQFLELRTNLFMKLIKKLKIINFSKLPEKSASFLFLYLNLSLPVFSHALPYFMNQAIKNLFFTKFYVQSLSFDIMAMFDQPLIEIFCGDNVLLPPSPTKRNLDMVYIFFEGYFRLFFVTLFQHQPPNYQFFVEVFSRFQNLNFGAFLHALLVDIKDVGHKTTSHLPRIFLFEEFRDIFVDAFKSASFHRRLALFKLIFCNFLLLLFLVSIFLFRLIFQTKLTHFTLQLFLEIDSPPKLHITIPEDPIVAYRVTVRLINFNFFPAEKVADLLSDDHQRLETFFNFLGNTFKKRKSLINILLLNSKHLVPYLVGTDKKSHTNSFGGSIIYLKLNFRNIFQVSLCKDSFHSCHKFLYETIVKNRRALFRKWILMDSVDDWMQLQPYIKQVHKNILTVEVRLEENMCFSPPLLPQLFRQFLKKNTISIELIDFLAALEELKFGVVVGLT